MATYYGEIGFGEPDLNTHELNAGLENDTELAADLTAQIVMDGEFNNETTMTADLSAQPSGSGFSRQLNNLTAYLVSLDLVAPEQIDSWTDNFKLEPSGKATSRGGFIAYRQTYDAVITIERWPHKHWPAELLFAHITTWLMDNDGNRPDKQDAAVSVDIEVLDEFTADIVLGVTFCEAVEIMPDTDGTIFLNNSLFRLANVAIDYAESGEVVSDAD